MRDKKFHVVLCPSLSHQILAVSLPVYQSTTCSGGSLLRALKELTIRFVFVSAVITCAFVDKFSRWSFVLMLPGVQQRGDGIVAR